MMCKFFRHILVVVACLGMCGIGMPSCTTHASAGKDSAHDTHVSSSPAASTNSFTPAASINSSTPAASANSPIPDSRRISISAARKLVAEVDSLRSIGQTFTDSSSIARAVATLQHVRLFLPTDYAHANYYYGRLLRDHGNQPAAMQAFLCAIHSHTKDHVIKGRSYCNMGIMCGLATYHELAYDMYERSAEEFLLASDTTAYYYALIDMAFARAEGERVVDAFSLLNLIPEYYNNIGVKHKVLEISAIAYNHAQLYDSVILCINELQQLGYCESTGLLNKAQAFDDLQQNDSAVYYAEQVMKNTTDLNDRYNALFILINDNHDLTKDSITSLSSQRADIGKLQEARQGQLSQAVQLLQQNFERKTDLTWLWTLLATLTIIGISLSIYIQKQKSKRQLISQQISRQKQQSLELTKQIMRQEQQQQFISQQIINQTESTVNQFRQKVLSAPNPQDAIAWNDYTQMCKIVNYNLFNLADKLEDLGLVEHEIRFCVLVVLKLRQKDCAKWMNMGVTSIGGKKGDIAQKLGQSASKLYQYLLLLVSN